MPVELGALSLGGIQLVQGFIHKVSGHGLHPLGAGLATSAGTAATMTPTCQGKQGGQAKKSHQHSTSKKALHDVVLLQPFGCVQGPGEVRMSTTDAASRFTIALQGKE